MGVEGLGVRAARIFSFRLSEEFVAGTAEILHF